MREQEKEQLNGEDSWDFERREKSLTLIQEQTILFLKEDTTEIQWCFQKNSEYP